MGDFLGRLFLTDDFMPHGHCYFWRPEIVWLHVISDALVAASYTSIPFTLYYFVRRRRDLPYTWMFLCFAVFIIACGATHAMEIVTLWTPVYRLSGVIKAITAVASVSTAVLLVRLVPDALSVPSPAALRTANAELQSAQQELRQTNAQLQAANAELEAFSYSVAHDLRAPLRAINGFSTLLAEGIQGDLDAESKDSLEEIRSNADHMGHLIDALLGLSRVTRSPLQAESLDLSELVRGELQRLAEHHPERAVQTEVQPGLVVEGDPGLLRAAITNLIENAWKFTARTEGARIEFGKQMRGDAAEYYIRDNGAGFDPEYAGRMFTAFQRFHDRKDFAGTGIGLATVKRIISRHGGSIRAEGAVGQGATFFFTLGNEAAQSRSREAAA